MPIVKTENSIKQIKFNELWQVIGDNLKGGLYIVTSDNNGCCIAVDNEHPNRGLIALHTYDAALIWLGRPDMSREMIIDIDCYLYDCLSLGLLRR